MKRTALIALISTLVLTPAVGEAAKGGADKSCPDDAICAWTKAGFEGKRVVISGKGVSNKIGNQINNKTSSIKNRFETTIFVYDKRNGAGESRCVGGLGRVRNLGGSYDFENRVASSDAPEDPGPCF
jgi:hypothetical protein